MQSQPGSIDAVAVVVEPVADLLRARVHGRLGVVAVDGGGSGRRPARSGPAADGVAVGVDVEALVDHPVAVVVEAVAALVGDQTRDRVERGAQVHEVVGLQVAVVHRPRIAERRVAARQIRARRHRRAVERERVDRGTEADHVHGDAQVAKSLHRRRPA